MGKSDENTILPVEWRCFEDNGVKATGNKMHTLLIHHFLATNELQNEFPHDMGQNKSMKKKKNIQQTLSRN